MNGLRKCFAILAALALSDIHWGVMQATAWIEMAADAAAREAPVWETVVSSVTGEKKCCRCCQLEEGRRDESERAVVWEMKNLGFASSGGVLYFLPQGRYWALEIVQERHEARCEPPATPPPRGRFTA